MRDMQESKKLDAVHIDKFDTLLDRVGLLDEFNNQRLKCKFCNDVVNHDNVYSILKEGGGYGYKLVCVKIECIAQLMELLGKRRKKEVKD